MLKSTKPGKRLLLTEAQRRASAMSEFSLSFLRVTLFSFNGEVITLRREGRIKTNNTQGTSYLTPVSRTLALPGRVLDIALPEHCTSLIIHSGNENTGFRILEMKKKGDLHDLKTLLLI
jgi:hypothetical protein